MEDLDEDEEQEYRLQLKDNRHNQEESRIDHF